MGHYMGDNAQSIFVQLAYRPVRGLRLMLDYTYDTKYRAYDYYRQTIAGNVDRVPNAVLAQKPFSEKIWQSHELNFRAVYEVS